MCKRAWVIQEQLLSSTNIHFTGKQLFWECRELSVCEQYASEGIPESDYRDFSFWKTFKSDFAKLEAQPFEARTSALSIWNSAVREYNNGGLTHPSDRLIAISGLA
ncbi:hypothetical protein B0O99DRAFT_716995 [Bisporella sp. PMI_857]|nr:hypothetical protein B0O99DRAFT_716995 [Bisporella sp. PMI_857]